MVNTKKAKKEPKKYDEIKKELERQKTALLAEVGEIITGGISPGTENFPDLGDQATAETDQNFLLRLKEREQKLLKRLMRPWTESRIAPLAFVKAAGKRSDLNASRPDR